MSTDFTLYALPPDAVTDAKRYASTSLGYGNTDLVEVVNAAALADVSGKRMAIFERPDVGRFRVEQHTTLHDPDDPCLPHDLVGVIGHDFPVIDGALLVKVGRTFEAHRRDPRPFLAFLEGARGRHLWYVFE